MKLYLVQHGEATAKDIDPDRPLTEQGKADVGRVAVELARAGVGVRRVIHSGKTRAAQTAEILADKIAPGVEIGVSDRINPLDDPSALDLPAVGGDDDTLLVGHLPYMARLAACLVTGNSENTLVNYQPGSVVCLESSDDGGWGINWMLRPELLP